MSGHRPLRRRRLPGRLALPADPTTTPRERLRQALGTERSALDTLEAKEKAELAAREPGRPRFALRFSVTAAVVMLLFAVLVIRLWSIQVIHVQNARASALATTQRTVATSPPRGLIEARSGQLLAKDVPEWVVTLKAPLIGSSRVGNRTTEQNLATLIPGLTVKAIQGQLDNEQYGPDQPVPVAEGITAGEAQTIKEEPGDFPGATVSEQFVRNYPQKDLAAQALGYLGPITCPQGDSQAACTKLLQKYESRGYLPTDDIGTSGLEEQYESVLRGKDGKVVDEVDPLGNVVKTLSTTPGTPGDTVVLNLDLGLEQELSQALANQIGCLRAGCSGGGAVPASWGAAVVLGPQGEVLAMATNPSYDNNIWVGGISQKNYQILKQEDAENNYAIMGTQPPGSTFKLATATAALDDGLISPGYIFDDPGTFQLPGGQVLHDSSGEDPGPIDVSTAITISSDDFFYNIGEMFWNARAHYGETPIQDMAAKYGFGQPSGIDLPGESYGWVDSPSIRKQLHALYPDVYADTWYLGDNVEMAFGQGETLVTPLEQAEAYATFADGGTRYTPQMAAAVVSPSGALVRRIAPKAAARVPLPASTYDAMLAGFEGAVQNPQGTAYQDFVGFPFSKWLVAGKTGTADVAPNSTLQPTAWFVCFGGPQGSSTRYTVAVEINQAGYGADAAAPVARQVMNYLYAHNGVSALKLP